MNLSALFEPRSIAVVGASTETGSVGNDILRNLVEQKFRGSIFPVNPKTDSLYGLPCFRSVLDIPEPVDLTIIVVPAKIVPQVLREAGERGTLATIVISAGFRETGNDALEAEIVSIARQFDIALLGPNCLGIVNPHSSMNASFAKTLPKKGKVAFLSQSGALGTAILDTVGEFGMGISFFASLGNKAVLNESALLAYCEGDRRTAVIALYAEELEHPTVIREAARRMARLKRPKPIIVLKSGTTKAGAHASSSHTGSLAGNDASYEALFEEAGILRARSTEELFLFWRALSILPLPAGKRVAVVTNAGGPGVLAADALVRDGLSLAVLSEETKATLRSFLPPSASVENPIDILGDAKKDRYEETLTEVLPDRGVDMVLVILTPQSMTDVSGTAEAIASRAKAFKKPVVAVFMGGKLIKKGEKFLIRKKIPVVRFPEDGVRMLSAVARFSEISREVSPQPSVPLTFSFLSPESLIDRPRAERILRDVRTAHRNLFSPFETLELLCAYGFPTPRFSRITEGEESKTSDILASFSDRLALKILSNDISHKTDVGGVLLDVPREQAAEGIRTMLNRVRQMAPQASLDGVLVMNMAPPGARELIAGSVRDPHLGHTVLVGSGGIYTEILQDSTSSLLPVSRARAKGMLEKLRVFPILLGARGGEAFAISGVEECLIRLSTLLSDIPDIVEIDLNPILVYPEREKSPGVLVVDGRVKISSPSS